MSHKLNNWIFRKSSPKGNIEIAERCYGDKCPVKEFISLYNIKSSSVRVIPYFNWLEDSFLLLEVVNEKMKLLDSDYIAKTYNLFNSKDIIAVSDIVYDTTSPIVLMVEYKAFPPNLVARFRKRVENDRDLVIVQYSLMKKQNDVFKLGKEIKEAILHLPEQL